MKRKNIISFVTLGFILCANVYFRLFPAYLPQLKEQAKNIVEQEISQKVYNEVDAKFGNYSVLARGPLYKESITDYQVKNKALIKQREREEYLKLKDRYQDDNGQTYLLESDCWHWARYVENIARFGRPGDEVRNSYSFDTLMLAPLGNYVTSHQFLFYLSAFLYKAFSIVSPVPLLSFLFFLPVFFSAIFVIALYLFCRSYGSNLAALVTCLLVGLAPIILSRSCAGWFDMDVLNLFFPLLIVWMYIRAYGCVSWIKRIVWVFLSAFCVGLFCWTWAGWWFIFVLIIVYELYSLLNMAFIYWQYKEKDTALLKQRAVNLSLFIFLSFIFCRILAGYAISSYLYNVIKGAFLLSAPQTQSIWPNVYSTVIELERSELLTIIFLIGGVVVFGLSWIALLSLFLNQRKYSGSKREVAAIFTFWALAMLIASLSGVRFVMFIVIPLGFAMGWAIDQAYLYLKNKIKFLSFLFVVLVISLIALFLSRAYTEVIRIFPFMNDSWYASLKELKERSPQDTVINSWWDYGSWFRVVSNRKVIFDGQSQNTPQAYWMASVLMSQDEDEAIRILRMLNNGGNKAFEMLDERINDPLESVFLLKSVLSKGDLSGDKLLEHMPVSMAQEMTKLLFNRPGKAYFVVDYTMLGKMSAISYLANWDFSRNLLSKNTNRGNYALESLVKIDIDKQTAQGLYQEARLIPQNELDNWVSSRYTLYSGIVNGKEQGGEVFFDNGVVYDFGKKIAHVYSFKDGKYKMPESLFIFDNDQLEETKYTGPDLAPSVVIFKNQEAYQLVIADRNLANSLFFRLYFLNGKGLKHFKPFIEKKDGDNYIRIFEISWD